MTQVFNAAGWLVDRHVAEGRGESVALLPVDGDPVTYEALQRATWRAAARFTDLGLRCEERVLVVMNDEPAFVAAFLGALRMGAVPVPVSTMLTAKDLGAIAADSGGRLLCLSEEYAAHAGVITEAAPSLTAVLVAGIPDGATAGADRQGCPVVAFEPPEASEAEVEPADTVGDSPGFWLYTSGTTGTPKGAMHRHIDLRATVETYADSVLGVTAADRCYSVAKLFFAYGLGNSLTFPLAAGAAAVLDPARPTPARVAENVARYRPSLFFASPGFCAALLDACVPDGPVDPAAFASVRLGVTAGEALPAELHRRFTERFGFPVLDGIGSTEALHIFCSNHLGAERPGTSGTPVAGYELKLLDDDGNLVTEAETPGYLHVKGESNTTGYWCRTDVTRTTLMGGWLRTGDVYTRSADGCYAFLGRNNDMMKVGGIWVSPAEVENVLLGHDDVLEAAVVGSRTEDGLETAVAFLVPRSGHTIDPASVEAHCRQRMAAFKRPREVFVVDALPKTATGKVQRFALRDRLTEEPGARGVPGAPGARGVPGETA